MAAYISVPRDLANVKTKVAFNLTKRQLICFGAAALVGVPLFFVLRDVGGNTAATLGMMIVMLPAFFLGMYQKNGQPAEKVPAAEGTPVQNLQLLFDSDKGGDVP